MLVGHCLSFPVSSGAELRAEHLFPTRHLGCQIKVAKDLLKVEKAPLEEPKVRAAKHFNSGTGCLFSKDHIYPHIP